MNLNFTQIPLQNPPLRVLRTLPGEVLRGQSAFFDCKADGRLADAQRGCLS